MPNRAIRGVARDSSGNAVASPTVTAYLAGTSTLASVFDSAAVAKANPFTGDADGEWEFYVDDATSVKVKVEATGFTTWEKDNIAVAVTEHADLTGLTAGDPHTQYLLLAGRAGQTVADAVAFTSLTTASGPVFNVKHPTFGATGNGSTDDAAAINAAIVAALAAGGGEVYFPPGVYSINSTIVLKKGVVLAGYYHGVSTDAAVKGSTIRAGANLTNMIETNLVTAEEVFGIRHLLIDGNKANVTVTTGLKLFGRKIRLDSVDVDNVSGTGVHFVRSNGAELCWVNWMTNCHVRRCDTRGILQESTDSWFHNNYFSNNPLNEEKCSGGNSWTGNHFDNASTCGMRWISDDRGTAGVLNPKNRIVGNYVDICTIGMQFTSYDGSTKYNWCHSFEGNIFRDCDVDLDIEDAVKIHVVGSVHTPGTGTLTGIRFTDCSGGLVSDCQFRNATYTAFFSGRPANVSVRNCYAGSFAAAELRSEASGTAVLLAGNTTVVVTHGLFGTPAVVQLTGISAGAVFFASAAGATTFTINVAASAGADRSIYWTAWMST